MMTPYGVIGWERVNYLPQMVAAVLHRCFYKHYSNVYP